MLAIIQQKEMMIDSFNSFRIDDYYIRGHYWLVGASSIGGTKTW